MIKVLIFEVILFLSSKSAYSDTKRDLIFPPDFLIGTASSAYQVEGAWDVKDKGESIWDYFVHNYPDLIQDESTGDITSDFYNKYRNDIELLKDIGFDHFRFSISWSRIFPNGYAVNASESGISFYHKIFDELEKRRIVPFVTIYHWDHPLVLENIGGWLNEEMAYIYADYAKFIFKEFGHRVKFFTTINEPNIFCKQVYATFLEARGNNVTGISEYLCVQNILKAHALAYNIYDKQFRSKQYGIIGIVTACTNYYPKYSDDTTSTNIAFDFECGWVMDPIFSKTGDYPSIMQQRIKERSYTQGYSRSRLPVLTEQWIELIRGSADYFGLNYYTSNIVEPLPFYSKLNWSNDAGLNYSYKSSWRSTDIPWLKVVPKGLGDLLRHIKVKYDNPPVYILENGVADNDSPDDNLRIDYLYSHMKEVLIAIMRDYCDVRAYTIWSFLDSFEWTTGFVPRFGLVDVDFDDRNRRRTPKKSASWLKSVLRTRELKRSY